MQSIDIVQWQQLLSILEQAGWTRDNGVMMAPRSTMWLRLDESWSHSWADFRESMEGRARRIAEARSRDLEDESVRLDALADVTSLISALRSFLPPVILP